MQLVSLPSGDGWSLDVAVIEPHAAKARATLIHVHGKGSNFYTGPARFIPEALSAQMPIRHIAINMRAHDLGYSVPGSDDVRNVRPMGGFWERLSDGLADIDLVVNYARSLAAGPLFLQGHSSGGFYVVGYCAGQRGIAGRILLSPLTTNKQPLSMWFPTQDALDEAIAQAQKYISQGSPDMLIPLRSWYYAISAESLLERVNEPAGVWLRDLHRCAAPTLMVWGGMEARTALWQEAFESIQTSDKHAVVVPGVGHRYVGGEAVVSQAVGDFVLSHV